MPKNIVRIGVVLAALLIAVPATAQALPPMEEILADRVLGNSEAPVTIIEYASKTCPHCAAFHTEIMPAIKKDYIDTGKAKLIFRDFPLDRLAVAASMVARCAPKERYFALVDIMFKTQNNWARSQDPIAELAKISRLAGVSQDTFDQCLKNQDIFNGVLAKRTEGERDYSVDSTPTFIVNGRKVEGSLDLEKFREVLDQAANGS